MLPIKKKRCNYLQILVLLEVDISIRLELVDQGEGNSTIKPTSLSTNIPGYRRFSSLKVNVILSLSTQGVGSYHFPELEML